MTSTDAPIHLNISEEAFDDHYPLIPNHLDPHATWAFADGPGCLFGCHGAELDFVLAQPASTVWTLVDGDETQHLLSGLHIVNRVGYLVSRVPVPDGVTAQVDLQTVSTIAAEFEEGE